MSVHDMKNIIIPIVVLASFAACSKEKDGEVITGTVQQAGGCFGNSWLVHIDNGNADQYSFLCKSPASTSGFNCSNSVYIINMPSALSQSGKRIKFSRWENRFSCLSSSFAPNHLEVFNLSAQ